MQVVLMDGVHWKSGVNPFIALTLKLLDKHFTTIETVKYYQKH